MAGSCETTAGKAVPIVRSSVASEQLVLCHTLRTAAAYQGQTNDLCLLPSKPAGTLQLAEAALKFSTRFRVMLYKHYFREKPRSRK